jgi:hypothetical protein
MTRTDLSAETWTGTGGGDNALTVARYAIARREGALMGLLSATDTDSGFPARRLGIADVVREYGEDTVRARITELREAGLHFAAAAIEAELDGST